MDPNAALKELREMLNSPHGANRLFMIIREKFQALDEWLSKGGFPPDDWFKVRDLRKDN